MSRESTELRYRSRQADLFFQTDRFKQPTPHKSPVHGFHDFSLLILKICHPELSYKQYSNFCQHSSVVEQLIRNEQVLGSNPSVGSRFRRLPANQRRFFCICNHFELFRTFPTCETIQKQRIYPWNVVDLRFSGYFSCGEMLLFHPVFHPPSTVFATKSSTFCLIASLNIV